MTTRKINTAAIIILSFLLAGCEIDTESNGTEYAFGSYVRIVCDDASFSQRQYDEFFYNLPDDKRLPIEQQLNDAKEKCGALSPIHKKVKPNNMKLTEGAYIPETVYLFKLSISNKDIRPVGLFKDILECSDASKKLSGIGYKTSECYERTLFWKHVWS